MNENDENKKPKTKVKNKNFERQIPKEIEKKQDCKFLKNEFTTRPTKEVNHSQKKYSKQK